MAQSKTSDRAATPSTCNNPPSRPPEPDAKVLTGRGDPLSEVESAAMRLDKIHRAQAELSRLTRGVRGRTVYLCLHRRKASGQVHLRWRVAGAGPRAVHISWSGIAAHFARLPGSLREWYERTHRHAIELNQREIEARLALKHACDRAR